VLNLDNITHKQFLKKYWQKKPLLIKQGFPNFQNIIEPDELAGLALEEDFESRMVIGHMGDKGNWQLKTGPFREEDFASLPKENWTLLVNGVDRLIPEVGNLLNHFNFLPQWRVDDVMISYAPIGGSVGPHFDVYDVFLLQGKGRRKWTLTTKGCHEENYEQNIPLRLMKKFEVEQMFILDEGDVLYIPPYVGHHGVALTDDCMTYSFGYRGYATRELWDSFGEHIAEKEVKNYYQDPDWSDLHGTGEITEASIAQARIALKKLIDDPELFGQWFGSFVTELDQSAQAQYGMSEGDERLDKVSFFAELEMVACLERSAVCRFAYGKDVDGIYALFINGDKQNVEGISANLIQFICDERGFYSDKIMALCHSVEDKDFIFALYQELMIDFAEIERA